MIIVNLPPGKPLRHLLENYFYFEANLGALNLDYRVNYGLSDLKDVITE